MNFNPDVMFHPIGFGQCGLIFEQPGRSSSVVKLAKRTMHEDLRRDRDAHQLIEQAFSKDTSLKVLVPRYFGYVQESEVTEVRESVEETRNGVEERGGVERSGRVEEEEGAVREEVGEVAEAIHKTAWWNQYGPLFPNHPEDFNDNFRYPSDVLISERILPLPKALRHALIQRFCPPQLQDRAYRDPLNKDCLVRIYLGKRSPRTGVNTSNIANFCLRNFNLHIDEMQDLGLPVHYYTRCIAKALATVHWSARVTGHDIEFVLGSARPPSSASKASARNLTNEDPSCIFLGDRSLRIWLLDFNQCYPWTDVVWDQPDSLIDVLLRSFFNNDRYFPWPHAEKDGELWDLFRKVYLHKAESILAGEVEARRDLPRQFIDACEAREEEAIKAGRARGLKDEDYMLGDR